MFQRILIANRGEIALRVIRTAREMGIECVAVYSDVDAKALHTRMAHVAVPLGGTSPTDAYLRSDKILSGNIGFFIVGSGNDDGIIENTFPGCEACSGNTVVTTGYGE